MHKEDSVYLDDEHVALLKWAAEAEDRSQAEILRDAIMQYTNRNGQPPRRFAMAGIAPGVARRLGYRSIADIPEEVLLEGFGQD